MKKDNTMNIKFTIKVKDLIPVETNEENYEGNLADTPFLITNTTTTNFTVGIGPCVAIAVCAKDIHGTVHRIICHCPYSPPVPKHRLEGRIEKYLKSIDKITQLDVVLASFDTFFEKKLSDFDYERDMLIINRINEAFSFWKSEHPDFQIRVIQSTSIGITPQGEFFCDPPEVKNEHYLVETSYESFNTVLTEGVLTLDSISERLSQFQGNEESIQLK